MNLGSLLSKTQKVVSDNSPFILTAIGVTGTITTAILAAKGAVKAHTVLLEEDVKRTALAPADADVPVLTNREIVGLTWKFYIPAVVTGAATVSCIIGGQVVGTRRAAALAAAYSLSEKAVSEYREKVIEKIGKEDEQQIRKDVAQEKVNRNPPTKEIIMRGDDEILCHDAFSGRYFSGSRNLIEKAENNINYKIIRNGYATLTDFYEMIGLPDTSASDEVGFNKENQLEVLYSAIMTPDDRPCLSFDFNVIPIRDPWRFL